MIKSLSAAAVAALLFAAACSAPTGRSVASETSAPTSGYDTIVAADGAITFPKGYETWTHMGSWAVVNEGGAGNGIHNVFTSADTIAHYQRTGEFPDGAVLVKEVFSSDTAQLTTGSAHWATDPEVWFVMVKDIEGRFPDNPLWGEGWGWALFNADPPGVQLATDFRSDCLGCHIPAQATDWIYTYAYPILNRDQSADARQTETGASKHATVLPASVSYDMAETEPAIRP